MARKRRKNLPFLKTVLAPDEDLIAVVGAHWIYALEGFTWIALSLGAGVLADYALRNFAGPEHFIGIEQLGIGFPSSDSPFELLLFVAGVLVAMPLFLKYISTVVALTNQRLIYKTGLILIDIHQVDLEDIRAEEVHHGWLGWLLGYGWVHLDCRFVEDVYLPAIPVPYKLVRAAHVARLRQSGQLLDRQHRDLLDIDSFERRQSMEQARAAYLHLKHQTRDTFHHSAH